MSSLTVSSRRPLSSSITRSYWKRSAPLPLTGESASSFGRSAFSTRASISRASSSGSSDVSSSPSFEVRPAKPPLLVSSMCS